MQGKAEQPNWATPTGRAAATGFVVARAGASLLNTLNSQGSPLGRAGCVPGPPWLRCLHFPRWLVGKGTKDGQTTAAYLLESLIQTLKFELSSFSAYRSWPGLLNEK